MNSRGNLEQWTQWSKRGAVAAELSRLMQLRQSVRLAGGTVTGFRLRSLPTGAASLGVDRDHLLLGTLNGVAKNVEFLICRPVSSLSHHRKFAASQKIRPCQCAASMPFIDLTALRSLELRLDGLG